MMTIKPMQIELAEQIRAVAEFDRAANALRAVAQKQRDRR
jgi:DNA polymerase II large subunit